MTTSEPTSGLAHHLLIAMPHLDDPGFDQTVTYVIEHSAEGAMGLTLNRPQALTIQRVFESMDIVPRVSVDPALHPVLSGGPVDPQTGFILHPPCQQMWQSTVVLAPGLWLTTSRDVLAAIACGQGPERSLIVLGYAGWDAGQLEQELAENVWLTVPAPTQDWVFEVPFPERWHAAAHLLGVDLRLLSATAGHA